MKIIKHNYDKVFENVNKNIQIMECMLHDFCNSNQYELTDNLRRVVSSGGKRLRPTLAYLCYCAGNEERKEILPLMCMLELMHTSSLIHDDVIDSAEERRNVPTINKSSGTFKAIQSGDYLLAKAMEMLHLYKGTGINEALAQVSSQMCLGEFLQMENLFNIREQSIESYFLQAKRKTAYLLATSCFTGAIAGGMTLAEAENYRLYGENIGIAFQLKDDLLDFEVNSKTGKTQNQDIRRGIFTYPILYLKEMGMSEETINSLEKIDKSEYEIEKLAEFINNSTAIKHSEYVIREYSKDAIKAIEETRDCDEKKALIRLAQELITRKL